MRLNVSDVYYPYTPGSIMTGIIFDVIAKLWFRRKKEVL